MNKAFILVAIMLVSTAWQPGHNMLMTSGMSMSLGVHSLVTMVPFLAVLLLLFKPS